MAIIKTKTDRIFVPISLQNSPHNPERDMLIIMKDATKIDKYSIDREETLDENKLAKQFQTRSFQFITSDPGERRNQLKNDLRNSYLSEGLMVIGGIQEPGQMNQIHLLLYKTDQNRPGVQGDNSTYDISVEVRPDLTNNKDFEMLLNQAQVESNQQLRSIITFQDTYSRHHFIVLQVFQADRLYIIESFTKDLVNEYHKAKDINQQINGQTKDGQKDEQKPKVQKNSNGLEGIDQFSLKMSLQDKITQFLNVEDKKGQGIVEVIVNTKFEDSILVFCST